MALARTNPLEPGVYWIDVWGPSLFLPKYPDGRLVMIRWLEANGDKVIEEHEDFASGTKDNPQPHRWFYKFQVMKAPSPFPFKELGFPTVRKIAPPEQIKPEDTAFKSDDTVRKPPPEPLFDFSFVGDSLTPLLILGALIFLFKESK